MRETSLTRAGGPALLASLALVGAPAVRATEEPSSPPRDGGLSCAWETVARAYHLVALGPFLGVTADVRGVANPGMNSARGPTAIFGVRLQAHL